METITFGYELQKICRKFGQYGVDCGNMAKKGEIWHKRNGGEKRTVLSKIKKKKGYNLSRRKANGLSGGVRRGQQAKV